MPIPVRPVIVRQPITAGGPSKIVRIFKTANTGVGYLAGTSPAGIATIDGAPAICEIRVLYRAKTGEMLDGALVAVTQSLADGTWYVGGLDVSLRYDVVARSPGFADVIVSDVAPYIAAGTINVYPYSAPLRFNEYATGQNKFGLVAVG